MALSEENEIKVCQILGVEPTQLDYQLNWLGDVFTAAKQTAVETEIERWDAGAGTDFTKIEGGQFAAFIDPEKEKNDIRYNIAVILERKDWANAKGGVTSRVMRG